MVFETLETFFRPYRRAYEIGESVRYECLSLDALPSTEKLHAYNIGNIVCVKPSYGFVSHWM